jgi:hypothetical protein
LPLRVELWLPCEYFGNLGWTLAPTGGFDPMGGHFDHSFVPLGWTHVKRRKEGRTDSFLPPGVNCNNIGQLPRQE